MSGEDRILACTHARVNTISPEFKVRCKGCSCNFIADWTIFLGKISIAGLALATSQLATTDLPECSYQPGPDFIFQNILQTLGFQSGLFFTTMRLWI